MEMKSVAKTQICFPSDGETPYKDTFLNNKAFFKAPQNLPTRVVVLLRDNYSLLPEQLTQMPSHPLLIQHGIDSQEWFKWMSKVNSLKNDLKSPNICLNLLLFVTVVGIFYILFVSNPALKAANQEVKDKFMNTLNAEWLNPKGLHAKLCTSSAVIGGGENTDMIYISWITILTKNEADAIGIDDVDQFFKYDRNTCTHRSQPKGAYV